LLGHYFSKEFKDDPNFYLGKNNYTTQNKQTSWKVDAIYDKFKDFFEIVQLYRNICIHNEVFYNEKYFQKSNTNIIRLLH